MAKRRSLRWVTLPLMVSMLAMPLLAVGATGPGSGTAAAATPGPSGTTEYDGLVEPANRWRWPVAVVELVGPFRAPPTPYASGHRGVDLAAAADVAVLAPSDAVVHFSGVVVDRPVLTLDHGDGVLSSFEPVRSQLAVGDAVGRGAPIGVVGTGGHCADACLHVGVRVYGEYVSPLLFFDRVPRSVLLPLDR